jgi:osmotically-inducible protein OsmY
MEVSTMRKATHWILAFPAVAAAAVSLAILACGEPAPEARLGAAGDALEEARQDAEEANDSLAETRQRLATAEAELHDARKAVREGEKRVLSAEALLERRATDVALFREIQGRLLEAAPLRQDAVIVRVDDGKVTLEGSVASGAARDAALEIARSTPGVSAVRDRLDVESDDAS